MVISESQANVKPVLDGYSWDCISSSCYLDISKQPASLYEGRTHEDAILDIIPVVMFFACLYLSSFIVSPLVSPAYQKLDGVKKAYWCTLVNSTTHAIIVAILSMYSILHGDVWSSGNFNWTSRATHIICQTFLGYITFDSFIVLYFNTGFGDFKAYLLHHSVAILAFYFIVKDGIAHPMAMVACTMEWTTPFINLRHFWDVSGIKDSHPRMYLYNGFIFTIGWPIVRIMIPVWSGYWFLYTLNCGGLNFNTKCMLWGTYWGAMVLQIMWYSKIIKGLMKYMKKINDMDKEKKVMKVK
jgi:hypothetical protein